MSARLIRDRELAIGPRRQAEAPIEFDRFLRVRLGEAARDYINTPTLDNMADIFEVMQASLANRNWTVGGLEAAVSAKRERLGGFAERVVVESVAPPAPSAPPPVVKPAPPVRTPTRTSSPRRRGGVPCFIEPATITNDRGYDVEGIRATCSKCGHETESFGTEEGSRKRCLALMREGCPLDERNFYIDEDDA